MLLKSRLALLKSHYPYHDDGLRLPPLKSLQFGGSAARPDCGHFGRLSHPRPTSIFSVFFVSHGRVICYSKENKYAHF